MRYTVARFEPEHHRPEPFLGRAVSLPELEGFPVATRHCLENPLLSREQVDVWTEAMEFFSNGYDQKLKPAHWGVFTARTLEAMFWRVLDMGPGPQTWHKGIALPSASKIQVYCESSLMHNLARDLTLTAYFASDDSATTASMEVPYPALTTQKEFLNKEEEGNARVHEFWKPVYPAMVVQALAAWDAQRFTDQKDENGKPRRFTVDVALAHEHGPLSAMSKLFGSSCAAGIQAILLQENTPTAFRSSLPGVRL